MVKGDKGMGNKGTGRGDQGKAGKGKAGKHSKNSEGSKGNQAPAADPEPAVPLTDEQKKQAELAKKMASIRLKRKWQGDGGNVFGCMTRPGSQEEAEYNAKWMYACDSVKTLETLRVLMMQTATNIVREQMQHMQELMDYYVGDADRQTIERMADEASAVGPDAWSPARYWEGQAWTLARQLLGPIKHAENQAAVQETERKAHMEECKRRAAAAAEAAKEEERQSKEETAARQNEQLLRTVAELAKEVRDLRASATGAARREGDSMEAESQERHRVHFRQHERSSAAKNEEKAAASQTRAEKRQEKKARQEDKEKQAAEETAKAKELRRYANQAARQAARDEQKRMQDARAVQLELTARQQRQQEEEAGQAARDKARELGEALRQEEAAKSKPKQDKEAAKKLKKTKRASSWKARRASSGHRPTQTATPSCRSRTSSSRRWF